MHSVVAELVGVGLLKHVWIFPGERNGQTLAALDETITFDQMRVSGPYTAAGNHAHTAVVEADSVDHKRVSFPMPDGVAIGCGIEFILIGMRSPIGIDVPYRGRGFCNHADNR